MHSNSLEIFKKYGLNYFNPNINVFEIGPDRQLHTKKLIDDKLGMENYNFYYTDISKEYLKKIINNHWNMSTTTLDSNDMNYHINMLNENQFDCEDDKFDIVYAGNVIEHVKMPWIWLNEIKRITKPNGIIIILCPGITQGYHREPVDCWRIWPDGFVSLFEYIGVDLILSNTEHLVSEPSGYNHIDTIAIGIKK